MTAIADALRDTVATKDDMQSLRAEMRELELRLTIKIGGMIIALGGLLIAIKYFG